MLRISLLCFLTHAVLICESNTPDNNLEVQQLHLFDGDIVLSSEQRQELHWNGAGEDASSSTSREARAVVRVGGKKWLDGEVPYQLSSQLTQSAIDAIRSAMDRIMFDVDRRVTFRQRLASDEDYLVIFPGDGCYSLVGRQGGAQNLSIGRQCESKGVVMHELIHALGRWHEQSRPDRDSYVEVQEENIKEGFSGNFQMVDSEEISTQGLAYDYDSIMHYDAFAFSFNDEPTLRPLDSMVALDRLGQRDGLSESDKEHIRLLYFTSQWSRWSSWSDCSASCGGGRQQRSRECLEGDCDGTSEERKDCNTDSCPIVPQRWGSWSAWSGCSRSCGGGTRVRIRSCLLAVEECEGRSMDEEKQDCNVQECPGTAEWGSWSKWTLCSESCQGGVRYRSRTCISKADNTIFVSNDQLFCTGEALESKPCFTNVSCEEISCKDHSCFNDTCLAGLMSIGCYHTPTLITTFVFLQLTTDRRGVPDDNNNNNTIAREDALRMCGEYSQLMNLMYFSLRGDECYCSHNVTDFIQAGPSQSCEGGIQVYQITEQENFELSVRALEGCGPGYCLQQPEDRTCSGGVWSVYQLAYTLQISLLLLLLLLLLWW